MRFLIILLLVFNFTFCFAQGPRFRLYRTNPCDNIERLDTTYNLVVTGDTTSFEPRNGTVYLPRGGKYKIWYDEGPKIDTIITLPDTGLVVFRYKEQGIQLYYCGAVDCPPFYANCGKVINGYAEDFYDNGVPRIRGTFNKFGYFKDSLAFYYPTGILKRKLVRDPKWVYIKNFDNSGHLIKEVRTQNKSFMVYNESREIEYYPDGKVKRKESSKKHIERIEEFYSSGKRKTKQTKTRRDEYYENGSLKTAFRWKRHNNSFIIDKKEYSNSGKLFKVTVYDYWADEHIKQPRLTIAESNWIINITTYDGKNKAVLVEDMDTKDFLSKYPSEEE